MGLPEARNFNRMLPIITGRCFPVNKVFLDATPVESVPVRSGNIQGQPGLPGDIPVLWQ
jgi:hypothetical protein